MIYFVNLYFERSKSVYLRERKARKIFSDEVFNKKFLEVGKPKKPNDEIYVGKWDEARHLEWAAPRKVVKKGVLNKIKVTSKNLNAFY